MSFGSNVYGGAPYGALTAGINATVQPSEQTLTLTLNAPVPRVSETEDTALFLTSLTLQASETNVKDDPAAQALTLAQQGVNIHITEDEDTSTFSLTLSLETPAPTVLDLPALQTLTLTHYLASTSINIHIYEVASTFAVSLTLNTPTPVVIRNITQRERFLLSTTDANSRPIPDVVIAKHRLYDPIVTGGCPQCGTLLYNEGRKVRTEAVYQGRNYDKGKIDDRKVVRCARCGFVCNTERDLYYRRGSNVGWGLQYTSVNSTAYE